jgi:hypothetical protein
MPTGPSHWTVEASSAKRGQSSVAGVGWFNPRFGLEGRGYITRQLLQLPPPKP